MILWSPIKCLFETLSCHQRSHTGQRAQNIISYDVVPYFVDHKVPFFLSTLISPGIRVFRTTTRWTTPSSHTRKSYSSSTRLSTWSSSPCRWKPYVCYYMDISAFKNGQCLFFLLSLAYPIQDLKNPTASFVQLVYIRFLQDFGFNTGAMLVPSMELMESLDHPEVLVGSIA